MEQIASKSCSFLQKGWTTRMLINVLINLKFIKRVKHEVVTGGISHAWFKSDFWIRLYLFQVFWHLKLNSQQFFHKILNINSAVKFPEQSPLRQM